MEKASQLSSKISHLPDLRLLIWTTTPWTLPANQAICVGPEIPYQIVKDPFGRHLIVGEALIPELEKVTMTSFKPVLEKPILGSNLAGIKYEQFFHREKGWQDFERFVYVGDHVTEVSGTGLVHTAPGHGHEDFQWAQKALQSSTSHSLLLEPIAPVDDFGCYTEAAPVFLQKLPVLMEGNAVVLSWLNDRHLLTFKHQHIHRVYPPLSFSSTFRISFSSLSLFILTIC